MQTAEILAQVLKFKGDLVVTALLAHGFQPEELDELMQGFPQAKEIALVGHEPELGALVGSLIAADCSCTLQKGATITLKKKLGKEGAGFKQLVDGGAKITGSRGRALKRLSNG